jgi:hypothetical protein
MSEAVTLADFLSPDFERLPLQLAAGIDETPELSSMKTLLMTNLSGRHWASLTHAIAGKVAELLQVPLTTILGRAWKDLKEVRAAMQTTRQSPDRTEEVVLADHSVESEHRPNLDLYQNGKRIGRIPFMVSVEIELRGLLLEIREGAIRKMISGDIRIKGTFKVAEFTLVEKASERVQIPGEIRFDRPAGQPDRDFPAVS